MNPIPIAMSRDDRATTKRKSERWTPQTGKPRYTADYLERMRAAGTPLRVSVFDGIDGFEQRMQEALDSVRDYGLFYSQWGLIPIANYVCAFRAVKFGNANKKW